MACCAWWLAARGDGGNAAGEQEAHATRKQHNATQVCERACILRGLARWPRELLLAGWPACLLRCHQGARARGCEGEFGGTPVALSTLQPAGWLVLELASLR